MNFWDAVLEMDYDDKIRGTAYARRNLIVTKTSEWSKLNVYFEDNNEDWYISPACFVEYSWEHIQDESKSKQSKCTLTSDCENYVPVFPEITELKDKNIVMEPKQPEPKFKVGDRVLIKAGRLTAKLRGPQIIDSIIEYHQTRGWVYYIYNRHRWYECDLTLAKYDAKTAEALEKAIRIYAHRAAGIKDDSECPLCKTFNACRSCPVWQFTNQTQCTDTPYWKWKRNPTPENAQKELDFLIGLRDY